MTFRRQEASNALAGSCRYTTILILV